MSYAAHFFKFWYHFIVGDDYRIALGVAVGLGGAAVLVHREHGQFWWCLPVYIVAILALSLWLEVRKREGSAKNG